MLREHGAKANFVNEVDTFTTADLDQVERLYDYTLGNNFSDDHWGNREALKASWAAADRHCQRLSGITWPAWHSSHLEAARLRVDSYNREGYRAELELFESSEPLPADVRDLTKSMLTLVAPVLGMRPEDIPSDDWSLSDLLQRSRAKLSGGSRVPFGGSATRSLIVDLIEASCTQVPNESERLFVNRILASLEKYVAFWRPLWPQRNHQGSWNIDYADDLRDWVRGGLDAARIYSTLDADLKSALWTCEEFARGISRKKDLKVAEINSLRENISPLAPEAFVQIYSSGKRVGPNGLFDFLAYRSDRSVAMCDLAQIWDRPDVASTLGGLAIYGLSTTKTGIVDARLANVAIRSLSQMSPQTHTKPLTAIAEATKSDKVKQHIADILKTR